MSHLSDFPVTFAPYVLERGRGRVTTGPFGQKNPGPLRGKRAGNLCCQDAWRSRLVSSASTSTWSLSWPTATIW